MSSEWSDVAEIFMTLPPEGRVQFINKLADEGAANDHQLRALAKVHIELTNSENENDVA